MRKRRIAAASLLLALSTSACADRLLEPDRDTLRVSAMTEPPPVDGELFRVSGQEAVYLSFAGARWAVPDVATLYACTGSFPGVVRTIQSMPGLAAGPVLPSVGGNEWMAGAVPVKGMDSEAVYVVVGCVKSPIPDLATLNALFGAAPQAATVPQAVLDAVPTGPLARAPLRRSGTLIQGPGTAEVRWVTYMGGSLSVVSGEALDSYCRFGADRIPESLDAAEWAAYPANGLLGVSASNCATEQPPIVRDGEIFRVEGSAAIFLSQQGRAYAIPDMATLAACTGGHNSVVRTLPRAPALRDGGVLPSVVDHPFMAGDMAVRSEGHPAVFAVIGCARSPVPDPDTFYAVFGPSGANRTAVVPDAVLERVPRAGTVRLPLRQPGTLIRAAASAEIRWVTYVGGSLSVENMAVLTSHCRTSVVVVSAEEFAAYPARARLEAASVPPCPNPSQPALQPDFRLPLPGGLAWRLAESVGEGSNVGERRYSLDFVPLTEGLPGNPPQEPVNVPVLAAAPGTVAHVGTHPEYGVWVMLAHESGFTTIYAHLREGSVAVAPGQAVERGQELARMGSTGNTSETRLHFEVRRFEQGGGSEHEVWLDQLVLEGYSLLGFQSAAFHMSSNPALLAPIDVSPTRNAIDDAVERVLPAFTDAAAAATLRSQLYWIATYLRTGRQPEARVEVNRAWQTLDVAPGAIADPADAGSVQRLLEEIAYQLDN